jgi:hypothetical protein
MNVVIFWGITPCELTFRRNVLTPSSGSKIRERGSCCLYAVRFGLKCV